MIIKKITKIKNTGILQDFNWSNLKISARDNRDLDFKKVNLIFGWNGTGKTTLLQVLRNFELGKVCKKLEKYKNSEYEIELADGSKLSHLDYGHKKNIRVFNKDFIEENIFQDMEQDGKSVKPIYYLGDKKIELTQERKEKEKKQKELGDTQKNLEEEERAEERIESSTAKHIKDTLLGIKEFQFYDRNFFISAFRTIQQKIENGETGLGKLKIETSLFNKNLKTIKSAEFIQGWINKIKEKSGNITKSYLEDISEVLLKTVSLQKTIERLKDDWELSLWVQKGLSLHKSRKSKYCEFCDQQLLHQRISDLEAHFNKDYTELSDSINIKINQIKDWKIKETEKIPDDNLKGLAQKLNDLLETLLKELIGKQKNILSSRTLSEETRDILLKKADEIKNATIKLDNLFPTLAEELESSLVADNFDEYKQKIKEVANLKEKEKKLVSDINQLEEKIKKGERDIKDFKLPAKDINNDLESFLGYSDLHFADRTDEYGEIYYEIKRGDEIAFNLSESEKTAISLIYFLRKIDEDEFNSTKGAVFIDDPVSSLDSQFLYNAYSFIVSAIEKDSSNDLRVGQFFLLTHNYDFFNLFKKKYRNRIEKNTCGLYMLRVNLNSFKKRVSNIYELDHLLQKFDSDYQYLFSMMIEFEKATDEKKSDLTLIYPYPNVARRVLETFLSFRFPSKTDYKAKIDSTKVVDKRIKESVYRFTNLKSHGTLKDAEGFSPEIIEPTSKNHILDVLKLMKEEDEYHYKGMEDSLKKIKDYALRSF